MTRLIFNIHVIEFSDYSSFYEKISNIYSVRFCFIELYYSQFDKHNCIDFSIGLTAMSLPLCYSITFSVCLRFHRNLQW